MDRHKRQGQTASIHAPESHVTMRTGRPQDSRRDARATVGGPRYVQKKSREMDSRATEYYGSVVNGGWTHSTATHCRAVVREDWEWVG